MGCIFFKIEIVLIEYLFNFNKKKILIIEDWKGFGSLCGCCSLFWSEK